MTISETIDTVTESIDQVTSTNRNMNVNISSDTTAFGELKVESVRPVTQISAQYGLLTNVLTVVDSASSGTNSVIDNKFTCDSGVAADGLASITSLRQLTYRAGQGALARFTAVFDTPAALNLQAAGLITAENAFAFGYSGTNFGIVHSHDGKGELQELTLTAAAGSETAVVTVDGVAYNVSLTGFGTVQEDAFEISESLSSQVPNYRFTSNNDQVVAQSLLPGPQGSFSYSSPGTSIGSWSQIVAGVTETQEFIAQNTWNIDTKDDLDPQMGNVYQIQFQYLGFGAITFFIEDSASGRFMPVHRIQFANNNTNPSVSNPTFRIGWLSRNFGNTSNIRIQGSSAGAFIEGAVMRDTPPRSKQNEQLAVGLVLTNIFALRNRISFGGKVNRAELFPLLASAASQTNKAAFFDIILNPTFLSPVTFEYVDKAGSIAETATDGVTVTGGLVIGSITVVDGGSSIIRFNDHQVTAIYPGTVVCIAAQMSSGAAADCQAAATWQEDL